MGIIPDDDFLVQPNKAQEAPQAPQSVGPIKKNTIADDDFLAVPKDAMPSLGTATLYGAGRNIIPSLAGLVSGTVGGIGGGLAGGGVASAYTAPAAAFVASTAGAYGAAKAQEAVWKPSLREQLAASDSPNAYSWAGLIPGFATGKFIDPKALATGGLKAGANAAEIAAANAVKRAARIELATEVGGELGGDVVINALTGQEQNLGQSFGQALAEGVLQGRQTRLGNTISQSPINLAQYLSSPSVPKPATPVTPGVQRDILAEARGAVDVPPVDPNAPIPLGQDGLPVATQGQIAGQNVPAITTSTPAVATPAVATPAVATPAVATPATTTPAAAPAAPAAPVARPSVEPGTAPAVSVGGDGRGQVNFVPNHIPAHENLAPEQLRAAHAAMEPAQAANSVIALNAEAHRRNGNIKPNDPAFTERILTHTGVALRDLATRDQGLAISTGEGLSRMIENQINKSKNNPEQSPYTPEQVFEMEYRKGRVDAIVEHLRKGGTEPLPYSVAGVTEYVKNMKYYAGKDAEVEAARNTPPSPEQAQAESEVDISEVPVKFSTRKFVPSTEPGKQGTGTSVLENGEAPIVEYVAPGNPGRLMVIRNINGVQVPFYLSTGSAGKKDVPAGKWYPFFGVKEMWINKTGGPDMANYQNRKELAAAARQLDRTIGDIRHRADRNLFPKIGNTESLVHINQGFNPAGAMDSGKLETVNSNIKNLFDRLDAAAAQRKPKPAAQPEAETQETQSDFPEPTGDAKKAFDDALSTDIIDGALIKGEVPVVSKLDERTAKHLLQLFRKMANGNIRDGGPNQLGYATNLANIRKLEAHLSKLAGPTAKPTPKPVEADKHEAKLKDAGYTKSGDGYVDPTGSFKITQEGKKLVVTNLKDTFDMQGEPFYKAGEEVEFSGGRYDASKVDGLISQLKGMAAASDRQKSKPEAPKPTQRPKEYINPELQAEGADERSNQRPVEPSKTAKEAFEEAATLARAYNQSRLRLKAILPGVIPYKNGWDKGKRASTPEAKAAIKDFLEKAKASRDAKNRYDEHPDKSDDIGTWHDLFGLEMGHEKSGDEAEEPKKKPLTKKEQRAAEKKSKEEKDRSDSISRRVEDFRRNNPEASDEAVNGFRVMIEMDRDAPVSSEDREAIAKFDAYDIKDNENVAKVAAHPGVQSYEPTYYDENGVIQDGSRIKLKEGYVLDNGEESPLAFDASRLYDEEANTIRVNNHAHATRFLESIIKKEDLPRVTSERAIVRQERSIESYKNAIDRTKKTAEKKRKSKDKDDIEWIKRYEEQVESGLADAELENRKNELKSMLEEHEKQFGKYDPKAEEQQQDDEPDFDPAEEPDPDEDPEDVAAREAAFEENDAENEREAKQRDDAKTDEQAYEEQREEQRKNFKKGSEKSISSAEKRLKDAEIQLEKANKSGKVKPAQIKNLTEAVETAKDELQYLIDPEHKPPAYRWFEKMNALGFKMERGAGLRITSQTSFVDPTGEFSIIPNLKPKGGIESYGVSRIDRSGEYEQHVDRKFFKTAEEAIAYIENETEGDKTSGERGFVENARLYRESEHGGAEAIPVDRQLPKSMDLDFGLNEGKHPDDAYYYRHLLDNNLGLNYPPDKKKKIRAEYDRVDAIIKETEAKRGLRERANGLKSKNKDDAVDQIREALTPNVNSFGEKIDNPLGDMGFLVSSDLVPWAAHNQDGPRDDTPENRRTLSSFYVKLLNARDLGIDLETLIKELGVSGDVKTALTNIWNYLPGANSETPKPKQLGGGVQRGELFDSSDDFSLAGETAAPPPVERTEDTTGDFSTGAEPANIVAARQQLSKLEKSGQNPEQQAALRKTIADYNESVKPKPEMGAEEKRQAEYRERVENDEVAKGILENDYLMRGRFVEADFLRPSAEIAEAMNVGIKNVSRLYQQLNREGLLEASPGRKVNTANGSYTTTYKLADGKTVADLKARLQEIADGGASAEAPRTDLKGVKGFQRGIQDMRDLLADSQNDKVRELRQANVDKMEALLAATKDKPTDNGRLETQRRKLRELLNGNTFRPGRSSGLDFAEMPRVKDIMARIASYEKLGKTSAATAESVLTPVSDNEPASITEARQQLSSIIKNMSRGEGWDAKRRDAEAKIEQFEVENKLLSGKYEPTAEDMEIISNAALEEFVAKFGSEDVDPAITAAVEAELAARFETQEKSGVEDTAAGDAPSQKGDLLADIRNLIAEHGSKYGIPTLPAEFGADSLSTLREQLSEGQVIALMRNPVGMGKVDAKRAKTDATYRKEMKDRAEGQLSDLATALSELGWTQFDPANFNTDDLVQAIVAAGRGEMLTPKGGVLGAAAPVDMKASGIIKRLYEVDQANPDDPFSRRDDARDNAPKKLFSYPNTKKFNDWTKGNQYGFKPGRTMPMLVRGIEKLRNFNDMVDGFVTTVFHGTKSEGREFDQFKPGSLTYFVADRNAAGMYAKDAPDMYYVRSSMPAVLTSPNAAIQAFESSGTKTQQGRIGKDLIDFYNNVASESFDSIDSFVSALEDGRLFDIDGRSQAGIQHQMSRWFLESATYKYDSVVFNDSTVSTESPTIVVSNDGHPKLGGDKPNTSVKAASNFGGFSSEDPRFNFSRRDLSPEAAKRELERRQARNAKNREGDPETRKGYQGIVSRITDELRLRGELSPKEIEGVTRIMNKIGAQFFERVKMKIGAGSRLGEYGQYQTVDRIITIFKDAIRNGKFEETAAHEIAHHIARFLPEADRIAVIKEMQSKRTDFLKEHKGLETLFSATENKDWSKKRFNAQQVANANLTNPTEVLVKLDAEELKKEGYKPGQSVYRLKLTDETYRLTNPNEYFAEEFKDNVMRELNSDPVYLGRSRNWKEKLASLWQDIKISFRKMFGKEIANKILSNFAKGRYNPENEGGAMIEGVGSDRAWDTGTVLSKNDRKLKDKRIVKGPDNDANSLYPIGEEFVRPDQGKYQNPDNTLVANMLGRNKMSPERAEQIKEFVKDSAVKHALYRGQNNAYETLDANSSTDGLFHVAADPDYATQYAQDFNKRLPKPGTSGAVVQVYINAKNIVDISKIGHSIDSRANIQKLRRSDADGLTANEHIAKREDEFINKIISEVKRINEGKDLDLTELREGLVEAFDEARDDMLNRLQTSVWQVFSHSSIHSLFNKYGVDAIKYSDSDLRTAQGGKRGGQDSYVLADPRRIKAAFGGNDVNTESSNIFQNKREPKQGAFDMRVAGEVRLQDAMGVANKSKLTEAEFERLASEDPSFNQREWQSVIEEGHFTSKGPDGRLTGKRVYKRIALPKMVDPSAEVDAQAALPDKDVSNSGNGDVLKSVRDVSENQSEDREVFNTPRPNQSVARSAWDVVSGRFFSGMSGKAHQNAKRHPYSDAVKAVANIIHARPGTTSNAYESDLPTAISTNRTKYHNRLNKIMEPLRGLLGGFKDNDQGTARDQREEVYQALTDMITGRKQVTSGPIGEAARGLKAMLADIHEYRGKAGEAIGEVSNYFPAVYDSPRIGESRKDFIRDAKTAYEIEFAKAGAEALAKELGITKAEYEDLAENDGQKLKDDLADLAEQRAIALYNAHVRGASAEEFDSIFGMADKSGAENPVMKRKFGREAQDVMRKWQVNDPFRVVGRYVTSGVKRAEVVRRFGNKGEKWSKLSTQMEKDGVPYEVISEMRELVRGAAGIGIAPRGKAGQTFVDTVTLATAASAMGRGFLNNLVEPVTIGMRTGSPIDILRAYAETWTRFLREIPALSQTLKAKMGETFWSQYGHEIGTIHNTIEDAWMTTHSMELDAEYADPRFRWLTNRVYKANLMDATETAKQQASHAIGFSFINRLSSMASGTHWTSKLGMNAKQSASDQLAELGVRPEDQAEFIEWCAELDAANDSKAMGMMLADDKMAALHREAMTRFSMQSSVRSNRAHKPTFQDDPLGKAFLQLMNFSYSYAAEVNTRMYDMAKQAFWMSPPGKDYTKYDRLRMMGPIAGGLLSILAYRGLLELKDLLYPSESSKQRAKDPAVVKWVNATSYAGLLGPKFEQMVKSIKRDQAVGGPVGQMAVNVGRAGKSVLESAAEGKDMSAAKKSIAKASVPLLKGGIVTGAAAVNPMLGTVATQATNAPAFTNAIVPQEGKSGGLTPDVFRLK